MTNDLTNAARKPWKKRKEHKTSKAMKEDRTAQRLRVEARRQAS
jgi:hypothetical protein